MRDIEKIRVSKRKYYANNRQAQIDRVDKRRRETRQWLIEKKATLECSRCGENHPATIQFHHTDPKQKDISIADAVARGWGSDRIEKEIAKCVVLCANCHAKEHYAAIV